MKLFVSVVVASIAGLLLTPQAALAADASDLQASIEVRVNETGVTEVTHIVRGDSAKGETVRIPIIPTSEGQVDIRTNDEDASTKADVISEQVAVNGLPVTSQTVEVTAPENDGWQIELTYENALVNTTVGSYQALIIDPFVTKYGSENIKLNLAVDSELPASLGLRPSDSVITNGRQVYEFSTDNARTKSITLTFGTSVSYSTTQKYELKNEGWWWKDYQIVLPPDSNQQKVGIESLSREPSKITVDQDGNIIAIYRVGPKKTVEVEAEVKTNVKSLQYQLPDTLEAAPEYLNEYVAPVGMWSSGEAVEADSPDKSINELIQRSLSQYSDGSDAQTVVNNLIADARASNIPARFMTGSIIRNRLASGVPETVANEHAWAELYFEGAGWMTLDPSFASKYASPELVDAFHIVQKVHGVSDVEPVSVPATVNRIEASSEEINLAVPEITQTKYLLIPGISLVKTKVNVSPGAVRDGIAYTDNGEATRLGSLAPLQQLATWGIAVGPDSWSASELTIGTSASGQIEEVLNSAKASISYLALILVILAIAVVIFLNRKFEGKGESVKLSEPDDVDQSPAEDLLSDKSFHQPVRIDYGSH